MLMKSVRNNYEQWWVLKTEVMKKAAAIGNSIQLSKLIKKLSIKNVSVTETISEKDGTIIHSQSGILG